MFVLFLKNLQLIYQDQTLSIILVILADFFGFVPTLRKMYIYPSQLILQL